MFALRMGLKTVSPHELQQLISQRSVATFDVNSPHIWMSAHVPGAINIDPAGDLLSDLPADKDRALVFYCSNPSCRKAPNAAQRAKGMGHTNVRVMPGGISGWLAAHLPTESSR